MARKFLDFSLPGSEYSTERKFHGSESSLYGLFAPGNESAEERKGQLPRHRRRVSLCRSTGHSPVPSSCLQQDKCAMKNRTALNQMILLSNYYIHIIYVVMYISCIGVKSLRQSATGQCGCRLGGGLIYYLVVIRHHDGTMHAGPAQVHLCPIVNTMTEQANDRLTSINWPVVCSVVLSLFSMTASYN